MKNHPQVAIGFSSDDYRPPKQQISHQLKGSFGNATARMDIKRKALVKHWTMGPSRTGHSHHPPFPQQVAFTQTMSREQAASYHQQTVPRKP
jgi:hypothetical protein